MLFYATVIVAMFTSCEGRRNSKSDNDIKNDDKFHETSRPLVVEYSGCVTETPDMVDDIGEVSFISDRTWKVGNQEWSDAITASKCQKETFYGKSSNQYNADCRKNKQGYGDLFSWCAVVRFQKQLCPHPWRVPTVDDFIALDKALGGNGEGRALEVYGRKVNLLEEYLNTWGGAFGGRCNGGGSLANQGSDGGYWSQSEDNAGDGFGVSFGSRGVIYLPQLDNFKNFGFTLWLWGLVQ